MIDFELSDAQSVIQRTARAVLRERSPFATVKSLEESADGFDRGLYRHMAQLGWLGLLLPESLGGQGESWVETTLLFEELGSALTPSPLYGAMVAAKLLSKFGAVSQHAIARSIVAGEVTVAPAFWEQRAKTDLSKVQTTGRREGQEIVLDGEKRAVEFGHAVDQLLVAVRLNADEAPLALVLIDRNAAGVETVRLDSLGGEPRALVRLSGVRAPADRVFLLRQADIAEFDRLVLQLRLLRAAELIGVAAAALDLAVTYANTRVQYGRPIGAFQAVQHKLATCALRLEVARGPVSYAAWLLSEGVPATGPVAEAVLKTGEMAQFVTAEAVQTHGGLGIVDGSEVSYSFRRAKARQIELGFPDVLREHIATGIGL